MEGNCIFFIVFEVRERERERDEQYRRHSKVRESFGFEIVESGAVLQTKLKSMIMKRLHDAAYTLIFSFNHVCFSRAFFSFSQSHSLYSILTTHSLCFFFPSFTASPFQIPHADRISRFACNSSHYIFINSSISLLFSP